MGVLGPRLRLLGLGSVAGPLEIHPSPCGRPNLIGRFRSDGTVEAYEDPPKNGSLEKIGLSKNESLEKWVF